MKPIDQLIPHRPPMQLLGAVLSFDDTHLTARVDLDINGTFSDGNSVSAVLGLEYLAQAAAAFFSLNSTESEPPRPGMLIACQNFACTTETFATGTSLLVDVTLASRLPAASQRSALVKFQGRIHALDGPEHANDPDASSSKESALVNAELSVYL